MHLWLDSIYEAIGEAIGDFLYVDSDTLDILHSTYVCLLVEMDISKGLPEQVCLESSQGSWTLSLDYEGIPFHCRKCHKTCHIATRCAVGKTKSRRPHSWWSGASSKHYMVVKSMDMPLDFVAVLTDDSFADDLLVEEFILPVHSPALVFDV